MKNFKVRCIRNENDGFTKGKVYKVRNGVIIDDDNYKASVNFENVEDLNKIFDSQFELVEKEPLKVGDWVKFTKKTMNEFYDYLDTDEKEKFQSKKYYEIEKIDERGLVYLLGLDGYDFITKRFKKVDKPLKVGDYVVTKKKIRISNTRLFWLKMIVENPMRIIEIDKDTIQLENEYWYNLDWLKKVEPPKEKKVFNIKDYDDETVMHVDTQEKADKFCEYLQSIGVKQDCNKYWNSYKEDTCLEIFGSEFTDKEWFEEHGYTILEFDDFIFEEPKVEECKGFKEEQIIYVPSLSGQISELKFEKSNITLVWYIDNGYAFHTKEEAERKKECMEILNQYKHEFSLEDWKNDTIKYTIDTDFNGNNLRTDDWEYLLVSSSGIWFKTQEDARKVAELIGYDDWCKYILNLR